MHSIKHFYIVTYKFKTLQTLKTFTATESCGGFVAVYNVDTPSVVDLALVL